MIPLFVAYTFLPYPLKGPRPFRKPVVRRGSIEDKI